MSTVKERQNRNRLAAEAARDERREWVRSVSRNHWPTRATAEAVRDPRRG